jgi:hypothetical protein
MATFDELLELDAEIAEQEAKAIRGLIEYLREAATELEPGTRLSREFVNAVQELEEFATPEDAGHWGGSVLGTTTRQIKRDQLEQRGPVDEDSEDEG